ncbi:MAG: hypothetical protein ACREL7_01295 [Longimicrobiales bacterium]
MIGTLDGAEPTVFGRIQDLAIDVGGDIRVLDSYANEIRRFTMAGQFRGKFGGRGSGPTEFQNPVAVAVTDSGRIVVASRGSLKVFDDRGSEISMLAQIPLGMIPSPRDMCVVGDDLVVRGWRTDDQTIVHVVTSSGRLMRSFGEGYRHGGTIVRQQLSQGPIACSNDPPGVVVAFHNMPIIQAYDMLGQLRWTARLPDFLPTPVVESVAADGAPLVETDGSHDADRLISLTVIADSTVMAQVARLGPVDPAMNYAQPVQGIRAFLLSVADGSGTRLVDGLAVILAATEDHLVGIDEDSVLAYTRVVIYDLPGGAP